MALSTYQIIPCDSSPAFNVSFDSNTTGLPTLGSYYYLTFTGASTPGCYQVFDNALTPVDLVSTISVSYVDCITCQSVPTPTPTPTQTSTPPVTSTPTPTPTITKTGTQTPTPTKTQTPTPTQTGTAAVIPTPTPSVTATQTSTPTQTPTPSLSPFALTGGTINYEDCVNCNGSITVEQLPHAIYSNAQGRAVVQSDSVELGGFNGLNS